MIFQVQLLSPLSVLLLFFKRLELKIFPGPLGEQLDHPVPQISGQLCEIGLSNHGEDTKAGHLDKKDGDKKRTINVPELFITGGLQAHSAHTFHTTLAAAWDHITANTNRTL